jgi:glycosyltransferase involved in cell wall biosynthesis
MSRKKILIDLRNLNNPTSGFGQIALNYAEEFKKLELPDIQFVFLIPEKYQGTLDGNAEVVRYTKEMKQNSKLLPKVDLWHAVNQNQFVNPHDNGKKAVFTIHDLNYLTEKQWYSRLKHDFILKQRIKRADAVTAISQYVAKQVEERFKKSLRGKSVEVIYDAVERIDHKKQSKPVFADDKPFFFTIGQIRMKKNFHLLIDVMKDFPEHNLYICGDDHFKAGTLIRKRLDKENIPNVRLTGKISEEEKVWLYAHCEAFLFPSQGEGFGLPVIEAMQFGIPVFVSPFTCLPEISGGHAFVWKDVAKQTMTDGIKQFIPMFRKNPDMAEKMRKHAFSFNYEDHVMKYVELYRRLLK